MFSRLKSKLGRLGVASAVVALAATSGVVSAQQKDPIRIGVL